MGVRTFVRPHDPSGSTGSTESPSQPAVPLPFPPFPPRAQLQLRHLLKPRSLPLAFTGSATTTLAGVRRGRSRRASLRTLEPASIFVNSSATRMRTLASQRRASSSGPLPPRERSARLRRRPRGRHWRRRRPRGRRQRRTRTRTTRTELLAMRRQTQPRQGISSLRCSLRRSSSWEVRLIRRAGGSVRSVRSFLACFHGVVVGGVQRR